MRQSRRKANKKVKKSTEKHSRYQKDFVPLQSEDEKLRRSSLNTEKTRSEKRVHITTEDCLKEQI